MSTNLPNQTPYLRTSRNFPKDPQALSVEIDKSYIDIANVVNARTIGVFTVNSPVVNGETWYLEGGNQKQQALRRVYQFTSAGNIPHGLDLTAISGMVKIYGTFTNGTNWYPLPYVDVVSATNQVNVIVTPTNIVITSGAGAPPAIVSGLVILEWISFV